MTKISEKTREGYAPEKVVIFKDQPQKIEWKIKIYNHMPGVGRFFRNLSILLVNAI